jgi:hypothetical protein
MIGNRLGVFERAAVLQIGRDASRPKAMATDGIGEGGELGPFCLQEGLK